MTTNKNQDLLILNEPLDPDQRSALVLMGIKVEEARTGMRFFSGLARFQIAPGTSAYLLTYGYDLEGPRTIHDFRITSRLKPYQLIALVPQAQEAHGTPEGD